MLTTDFYQKLTYINNLRLTSCLKDKPLVFELRKDCFATCNTFLNNKPDRCPGQRNQNCVAGCVCAPGFVREKPNLGCIPESQCTCKDGFVLTADGCEDEDECTTGNDCDESSTNCINREGSYECRCKYGYAGIPGDKTSCEDINECSTGAAQCGPNGACVNEPGGFTCNCNQGQDRKSSSPTRPGPIHYYFTSILGQYRFNTLFLKTNGDLKQMFFIPNGL